MKKHKIRSGFLVLSLSASMFLLSMSSIAAYENKRFAGEVKSSYKLVSYGMRKDSLNKGLVNWQKSNMGSHKQWFQIRTSSGIVMGSRLIPKVNDGKYVIPNTNNIGPGRGFKLYSAREHIINPATYVEGIWSADDR